MRIALTNDDGIYAVGLRAIYKALSEAGHEVTVFAPMTEQSAVGHAITVAAPVRLKYIEENDFKGYGIFGTPADCVKLGIGELMPEKPDLVVSGINAGANVGPDILYSGTVAAATEAAHLGFRAVAVSYDSFTATNLVEHAKYAVSVIEQTPFTLIPPRGVLNLNLPDCPLSEYKGVKVCKQTSVVWRDWYHKREDPRGRPYWWLNGEIPLEEVLPDSDKGYLVQQYATLTPLRFDFTDTDTLKKLEDFFAAHNNA